MEIFSGEECEICRKVVEIVAHKVDKEINENIIVEVMRRECRKMRGFEHKCMDFVNKDVKKFVESLKKVLENSITAIELCRLIRVCVSTESENDEFESLQVQNEPTEISSRPECLVCTSLMHIVLRQIDDIIDENKIMAIMRRECREHNWNGKCMYFVESDVKKFVELLKKALEKSITVNEFCKLIGACDIKDEIDSLEEHDENVRGLEEDSFEIVNFEDSTDKWECKIGLFVVSEAIYVLSSNWAKEKIVKIVEEVCYKVNPNFKQDCDKFAITYTDELVRKISENFSPREICVALGLCAKLESEQQDVNNDFSAIELEVEGGNCPFCLLVVTEVYQKLDSKASKEEIVHVLEKICNHLKSKYKQECDDFVKTYAGQLVHKMMKSLTPQKVCAEIGLCDKAKNIENEKGENKIYSINWMQIK